MDMDKDNLIKKWLSGGLTQEEKKAFDTLEDAPFYKDILADAANFKASRSSKVNDFDTFKKQYIKPEIPVKKLHWSRPMMRIASVMVVSLGIYYFLILNKPTVSRALAAEKTTIELPDASKVVLNSGSEVSYDKNDWNTNRVVNLKGEAFFDVAKGAKFDVVTPKGTVTVLGTEFNVKQRGDFFEVACFEGTVRVTMGSKTVVLKPGDNFTDYRNKTATGKHSDQYPKWTHNMSQFDRMPVTEVIAELERQYNIDITTEKIDTEQLFTGTFAHSDLESALKAISEPLGIDYKILKQGKVRLSSSEQ